MLFQKLFKNTQLLIACVIVTSCTTKTGVNNSLLQEWTCPYGGLPAFDQIDIGDVQDAMVTAMDMSLAEIEMIANNPVNQLSKIPLKNGTIGRCTRSCL